MKPFERDMDDEIRFHLEMEAREHQERGVPEDEAKRRARVDFGSVDRFKDELRDEQTASWLRDLVRDLQFAVRWLAAAPGFTIAAVLTLGIGVGASAAILGSAHHILLKPLPFTDSERVVTLRETDAKDPTRALDASIANFLQLRARSRSFAALGIAEPFGYDLVERGATQSLSAFLVTDGFIQALGLKPEFGSAFKAGDFKAGAAPVVMLSNEFWRTKFHARPDIIGSTVQLDDFNATVVGVLPPGLPFPEQRDVWTPRTARDDDNVGHGRYMVAVGRLAAGVSPERAQAEVSSIAAVLAREAPSTNTGVSVKVIDVAAYIFGPVRNAVIVLSVAVAMLLLIACANIANLLLARGLQRRRELAIRAALGANGGRLRRQLLTESLVLALLGGALGVIIAYTGIRTIRAFAPPDLPRVDTLHMNATFVLIALGITVVTGCLVGIAPAARFSRIVDVFSSLRGGSGIGGDPRALRLRHALVSMEIAFAIVLLVAAGLLTRSFIKLTATDLGFEPQNRVEWQTFLWDNNQSQPERVERVRAIELELATTNGITGVAAVSALPFHPHRIAQRRELGVPGAAKQDRVRAVMNVITPRYFDVMRIAIKQGRPFTDDDNSAGRAVAILNHAAARTLLPGIDPIGRTVAIMDEGKERLVEVVGTVSDVRATSFDHEVEPNVYVPHAQDGTGSMTFVAMTSGGTERRLKDGEKAIWRVDPTQSIYHSATLESLVSQTLAERRFNLILIATFSVIGLLVSLIGVYGLLSFTVRARSKEIGLRIALGAKPGDVVLMVMREASWMTIPGVLIGLVVAMILTRGMTGMLYQVAPMDGTTLLTIAVAMLATSYVAAFMPAFRAARLDPITVLRAD